MENRRARLYRSLCCVWYAPFAVRRPHRNGNDQPFFVEDTSAFLVIVYSAKDQGPLRASGVPNILDRIFKDATVHFLVIFTAHLLLIFFQLLAPVSNLSADLHPSAHDEVFVGNIPTPPRDVSHHL